MNRKKQSSPLITALYCRLSLEDGRDNESMSISNQKAMLRTYAEQNGVTIHSRFTCVALEVLGRGFFLLA